jgi:hypothetical protein
VDTVLRTKSIGHFFPGGRVDGFDVWLELQALDENGRTVFWSGRMEDNINRVQLRVTYAQPPLLFHIRGNKQFEEVANRVGPSLKTPKVARGTAFGDIDNDGDPDLLLTTSGGPAYLYRNEGGNRNHFLVIKTEGTRSNRDGIGAIVKIKLPDGNTQWQMVKSGSSYCSQNQLPLIFGIGSHKKVDAIEISWPSSQIDKLPGMASNQFLRLKEGVGIEKQPGGQKS